MGKGGINTTIPTGLQNVAFFVVGKRFCLRGGQEHRQLQLSQLKCLEDKYVYYENVSKNTNGSFKQLYVKNKVVPLYLSPEAGERCPVTFSTGTSVSYHLKQEKRICSMFDCLIKSPVIPTGNGIVQFLLSLIQV